MQNLWEKSIEMNHATQFTNVCARQFAGICTTIKHPKKHVLKKAVICTAPLCSLMCTLLLNHLRNFPIFTFTELRSNVNSPCLVNLVF